MRVHLETHKAATLMIALPDPIHKVLYKALEQSICNIGEQQQRLVADSILLNWYLDNKPDPTIASMLPNEPQLEAYRKEHNVLLYRVFLGVDCEPNSDTLALIRMVWLSVQSGGRNATIRQLEEFFCQVR